MRMVKQAGQKPGSQPGTTARRQRRAGPQRQAREADGQAGARRGGKDEWGHLPDELRQEMENVFKEEYLPSKDDLIRRYYLSVAKKSLVREE